jgi:hypothetical protein
VIAFIRNLLIAEILVFASGALLYGAFLNNPISGGVENKVESQMLDFL